VLNRCGFTCQYCGRKSPEVILHVDHIIPLSEGGTSLPENLIASCSDCNSGKGAKPIVQAEPVSQEILDSKLKLARDKQQEYLASEIAIDGMAECWSGLRKISQCPTHGTTEDDKFWSLPRDFARSIRNFMKYNLTEEFMANAMKIAFEKMNGHDEYRVFRYFCGICWRTIRADLPSPPTDVPVNDHHVRQTV